MVALSPWSMGIGQRCTEEDAANALCLQVLAASKEAFVAAEDLASAWAVPHQSRAEVEEAAGVLAGRLMEAISTVRIATEHLVGAIDLAKRLQDHLAKSQQFARTVPAIAHVPPSHRRLPELARGNRAPEELLALQLPDDDWPASRASSFIDGNRPSGVVVVDEDSCWSRCWQALEKEGWTFKDTYYCPPGVEIGQPGIRRGRDFFDSRRQVLCQLRDCRSLAPEMKDIVVHAIETEDRKSRLELEAASRAQPNRACALSPSQGSDVAQAAQQAQQAQHRQAQQQQAQQQKAQLQQALHQQALHQHQQAQQRPRRAPAPPKDGCAFAEWQAKDLLQSRRRIQDEDILNILEAWKFRSDPDSPGKAVSETLGLMRLNKLCVSQRSQKFPCLTQLMCRYLHDHPPDGLPPNTTFPFTSVHIHKGHTGERHRDKHSYGLSVMRAVGNFSGGTVRHWPQESGVGEVARLQDSEAVLLNMHGRSVVLDTTLAHEDEPFEGTRYSLTYYSVSAFDRASTELRQHMAAHCGIEIVPHVQAIRTWSALQGMRT